MGLLSHGNIPHNIHMQMDHLYFYISYKNKQKWSALILVLYEISLMRTKLQEVDFKQINADRVTH